MHNATERRVSMPDLPDVRWSRVEFWIRQSLRDLDFRGKQVLDVGAGGGLFSCYMALQGAARVVALEPELEGSALHPRRTLLERVDMLGLTNVVGLANTFQEYAAPGSAFDVILVHNAINHLDEEAVVALHRSEDARASYRALLGKIYELLKPGGVVVIADCARANLFAWLGIRNPVASMIEWDKHQNPNLWVRLLRDVGFDEFELHWTYPRRLRILGAILDNWFMSFLMQSHFVLHAHRVVVTKSASVGERAGFRSASMARG
jgi:SAM-dependent methyltransferase